MIRFDEFLCLKFETSPSETEQFIQELTALLNWITYEEESFDLPDEIGGIVPETFRDLYQSMVPGYGQKVPIGKKRKCNNCGQYQNKKCQNDLYKYCRHNGLWVPVEEDK